MERRWALFRSGVEYGYRQANSDRGLLQTLDEADKYFKKIQADSAEPVEYPSSPPSQMEREIAKLLHIEYCEDLAEEGTPWEVPAEPEPSYFATLKEAIEFRESLPEDSSSPQVTPPKYDPSWHGSQAHTFDTDKPVGSEVKPRTGDKERK